MSQNRNERQKDLVNINDPKHKSSDDDDLVSKLFSIGGVEGIGIALISSTFILGIRIYEDMKLFSALPMSQWLFEPRFWQVTLELTILLAGLALIALTPVGPTMAMVALFVSIAYLITAGISSALSPKKNNESASTCESLKPKLDGNKGQGQNESASTCKSLKQKLDRNKGQGEDAKTVPSKYGDSQGNPTSALQKG